MLHRVGARRKGTRTKTGAKLFGGRWNPKGIPVIYTSDSTALAILETLVHFSLDLVPQDRSILILNLPDNLPKLKLDSEDLPEKWWINPAPPKLAFIGKNWIEQNSEVALVVPSSITPQAEGRNYILNPRHPDFSQIEIVGITEYRYDSKFFSQS